MDLFDREKELSSNANTRNCNLRFSTRGIKKEEKKTQDFQVIREELPLFDVKTAIFITSKPRLLSPLSVIICFHSTGNSIRGIVRQLSTHNQVHPDSSDVATSKASFIYLFSNVVDGN